MCGPIAEGLLAALDRALALQRSDAQERRAAEEASAALLTAAHLNISDLELIETIAGVTDEPSPHRDLAIVVR